MKFSVSRSSFLTILVVAALLLALPFAVLELIRTREFYMFSHRFFDDLVARFHGAGRLRFILQPTVAIVFGIRDGRRDARVGKPPFLWNLIFHSERRRELVRSAFTAVRDLVAVAILLDVVAQILILRMVNPFAALLLGPVLIALPYASACALANRAEKWRGGGAASRRDATLFSGVLLLFCLSIGFPLVSRVAAQQAPASSSTISEQDFAKSVHNPIEDFIKVPLNGESGW